MFNAVAITSILASVASASFLNNALIHRDDCADCPAPVTVTNTVTVTDCPAAANAAIITKYITVPCSEQRVSPVETSAPPPPPAPPAPSTGAPPPPPPPPPATTGAPIHNKNITIPEPTGHGKGCPAYGCGTDLPIITDTSSLSSPSSTFSMPSSTNGSPSVTTSACPPGGCTSRATANTVGSMPVAVAVLAAVFVLF